MKHSELSPSHKQSSLFSRFRKLLKIRPKTQDEILEVLRASAQNHVIDDDTLNMIASVIAFTKLRVRDIMLPKKQIAWVPVDARLETVIQIVTDSGHSRFPVIAPQNEEVVGVLHAKNLLRYFNPEIQPFNLMDVVRQATVVPESKRLDALLRDFKINRNHMAIVVDEYGAVSGFVTLEDVIEQIIGDIADEFDIDAEAYIKVHGDKQYMLKAETPISEFNQALQAQFDDEIYDTIGGIIMAKFGHLPRRGEKVLIQGFQFNVVTADARHIKLLECIDKRMEQTEHVRV